MFLIRKYVCHYQVIDAFLFLV